MSRYNKESGFKKMALFLAIHRFFVTLLLFVPPNPPQSSQSPSAPNPTTPVAVDAAQHHQQQVQQAIHVPDIEKSVAEENQQIQHHQKLEPDPNPVAPHNNGNDDNNEFPAKVIGFCFALAVAVAVNWLQSPAPIPLSFHFLSLTIVVAVTLLFVSNYMIPKSPNLDLAQVVERVGVFFGVAALIFAITIPSPLYLKLIHWAIFLLPLLAIFVFNRR